MIYTPCKMISDTDFQNLIGILAYDPSKSNTWEEIAIGYNQNGVFTICPTPTTDSNGHNITTTAFVNNRLPYTEGTWVPTIYGASTAGVVTYSQQRSYYMKIGKLCYITCNVGFSSYTTHPVGTVRVGGLPFAGKTLTGSNYVNLNGNFLVRGRGGVDNCVNKIYAGFVVNSGGYIHFSAHNSTTPYLTNDATFNSSSSAEVNIMFNSSNTSMLLMITGVYYTQT